MTANSYVLNVIYTPGTFAYLRSLTASLCREPRVRARLVANGCGPAEVAAMRAYGAAEPDVVAGVVDLGVGSTVLHSVALEQLLATTDDGAHFAFADSDMLATGAYLSAVDAAFADGAAGVFAGLGATGDPTVPAGTRALKGNFALAADGTVFGTTYFAVYDRFVLEDALARHGIGLVGRVRSDLPDEVTGAIGAMGYDFELYDTAKVLNLLLLSEGQRLVFLDVPELVHLGGVSSIGGEFAALQRALNKETGLDPDWEAYQAVQAAMLAELKRHAGEPVEPEVCPPELEHRVAELRRQLATAFSNGRARP